MKWQRQRLSCTVTQVQPYFIDGVQVTHHCSLLLCALIVLYDLAMCIVPNAACVHSCLALRFALTFTYNTRLISRSLPFRMVVVDVIVCSQSDIFLSNFETITTKDGNPLQDVTLVARHSHLQQSVIFSQFTVCTY